MAQEPGSYKVLRYVYVTMKRRETREVLSPVARPAVLERSCADVSFLAGMLVEKFVWHLPLRRQHKWLEGSGIHVSRSSLNNWTRRSIDLLQPVFEAQCGSVLSSAAIAMDETSMRAGRDRPGHMRRSFLRPIYGDRDEVVFHCARPRAHRHAREFQGDFEGTLLSDGYGAYVAYAKVRAGFVTHAQCWSHARRGFEVAQGAEPRLAGEAMALIGALYRDEKRIREKGLCGTEKLACRATIAPLASAFPLEPDWSCLRPPDGGLSPADSRSILLSSRARAKSEQRRRLPA